MQTFPHQIFTEVEAGHTVSRANLQDDAFMEDYDYEVPVWIHGAANLLGTHELEALSAVTSEDDMHQADAALFNMLSQGFVPTSAPWVIDDQNTVELGHSMGHVVVRASCHGFDAFVIVH